MTVTAALESRDKKIAVLVSMALAILMWALLHLFGYKIPTPPTPESLKYIDAEMEFIELEKVIPVGSVGGGGSGTPDNSELSDYTPQNTQVLTQHNSNTHINSGASSHNNTSQHNNTNNPSTTEQGPTWGSGGSGGGNGGGRGHGVGNDTGDGRGDGPDGDNSGAANRYLVKKPNTSNIVSDETCTIIFTVIVNADGDIVGYPEFVRDGTTTDNQALIKKVRNLVQSEARYNAVKGASNVRLKLTVNVKAS